MHKWPVIVLRAMRPAQWTKNSLVFAALIFAWADRYQPVDRAHWLVVTVAATLFCLLSSAIYLLNDIRDREQDRLHPQKRMRPIAAGELSVPVAAVVAGVLAGIALVGGWYGVGTSFAGVLVIYALMQVAYTFGLKRVALVDVFVIAAGFVLRALAGGVAIQVHISPWLLLCTGLLALFLALCKRRHEKVILENVSTVTRDSMRSYDVRLLDQLIAMVSSATVVCYALYTLWPDTIDKFGTARLSFTIPFVLFGLFRYLDLVYRHEQGGQPERILLTDWPLIINLLLYGGTVLLVLYV